MNVSDAHAGQAGGLRSRQSLLDVLPGCYGKIVQRELRGKREEGVRDIRIDAGDESGQASTYALRSLPSACFTLTMQSLHLDS